MGRRGSAAPGREGSGIDHEDPTDEVPSWRPPDQVLQATVLAACFLVLVGASAAAVVLVRRLQLVIVPVVVAALVARALAPVADGLARRGWRPGPRVGVALGGGLVAVAVAVALLVPAIASEADGMGDAVGRGVDRVETWIVDTFPVDRTDVRQAIDRAGDQAGEELLGGGALAAGAEVVGSAVGGLVLSLVLAYFILKDGPRFQRWAIERIPAHRRDRARAMASGGWSSLGGYLRGAALLGLVEAAIMGTTLAIVGAELAVPVAVVTFLAAFVPFAGAIFASALAVLVALASADPGAALVVLVVAIAVQQLDNDLLAPVIYGRALQLHPAAVLGALVVGTALLGLLGAALAVPVVAVASGALAARSQEERPDPP
ncbi:MAG: AI-2E family transporter [Acidimicrobiales bacterium]|nr:AI-2E family transporter [Acidimicrobiales bacterium]